MCLINSCTDACHHISDNKMFFATISSVTLVTAVALAVILSGYTTGTGTLTLAAITFGIDVLALSAYALSSLLCERNNKELDDGSQTIYLSTKQSSSESFHSVEESPRVPAEKSPPIKKPPQINIPPREYLAKQVVPAALHSFARFLEAALRVDSKKTGESSEDCEKKVRQLHEAVEAFSTHFQNLVKGEGRPRQPAKTTQLLRRMLTAWNTKQYNLLPTLFNEYELAEKFEKGESVAPIPPQKLENEEDLKNLARRIIFHCGLILNDIEIIISPSTSGDMSLVRRASVSYLMIEAKELATAEPAQRAELEEILAIQTEINEKYVWSKWTGSQTQEYMFVRTPDQEHQDLYKKMISYVERKNEQRNNQKFLPDYAPPGYTLINCTLGKHGTWALKNAEQSRVFQSIKNSVARLIPYFKGYLVSPIRTAMINENLLNKEDKSLNTSISQFVDTILPLFLHILTQQNGMDTATTPILKSLRTALDEINKPEMIQDLNGLLKTVQKKFEEISKEFEENSSK